MATDVSNENDLNDDEVSELLATTKTKGLYVAEVKRLMTDGVRGRKFPLDSGTFSGKKGTSVKASFLSAVKAVEGAESIRVIDRSKEGYVALINTEAAAS